MLQRFIGHDWPEIRATDTDVDDVANALASVAFPRAASHAVGEVGHLVENGVDLRAQRSRHQQRSMPLSVRAEPRAERRGFP